MPRLNVNPFTRELTLPSEESAAIELFISRLDTCMKNLQNPYACLITELFPFSGHFYQQEVLSIYRIVKSFNPKCKLICCLKDIPDKRNYETASQTLGLLIELYDRILIHSDPSIVSLQDSWPYAKLVNSKIFYTGFIPNGAIEQNEMSRQKRIVVSNGTGTLGADFIKLIAETADSFPDYEFRIILGPQTPPLLKEYLDTLRNQRGYEQLNVCGIQENYCELLQKSALSIGLGGYSLVDIAYAKTPALCYPVYFYDQIIRAKHFAQKGLVQILQETDLEKNRLAYLIKEALYRPYPNIQINMNGVKNSKEELIRLTNS